MDRKDAMRKPTGVDAGVCLAIALMIGAAVVAEPAGPPMGSPDFRASPERPMGWRGDGTGRFSGATPPAHWTRVAAGVKGLRAQATKPKEGETGKPVPDGVIREWLVLGPVPKADEERFIQGLTNKVEIAPNENDQVSGLSWTRVATDTATLDFCDLYGGKGTPTCDVAFAFAYLYSPTNARIRLVKEIDLVMGGGAIATYVNGALLRDRDFALQQGWNRILFRVVCGLRVPGERLRQQIRKSDASRVSWYVQPIFAVGADIELPRFRRQSDVLSWAGEPVLHGRGGTRQGPMKGRPDA